MHGLSTKELERYQRQILINDIGLSGQQRLRQSVALVAGVGGLGCTAVQYLAAAGVGRLILVDRDSVELTNLNRQILHWEDDLGMRKTESAAAKIQKFNSDITVEARDMEISLCNVQSLLKNVDVVVDGLDSYAARVILNQACVDSKIPFIYASVYGLSGQLMTIIPGQGPCYQCVRRKGPVEDITVFPILGSIPGLMACLQSLETIKLLAGLEPALLGRMLLFNDMSFHSIAVKRRKKLQSMRKSILNNLRQYPFSP